MKELVKLRRNVKAKKPKFLRQEAHKIKKLDNKWRKPKGLDSKMRRGLRGYRRVARIGYGSPKKVSGLNADGFKEARVRNLADLSNVKEGYIVVISGRVGLRKKVELLKEIEKLKFKVSNVDDIKKFLKDAEGRLKKKKKEADEKEEKKKKSKEESLKKADEAKKKEEEKSEEDKKEDEETKEKKVKKQMSTEQAVGGK